MHLFDENSVTGAWGSSPIHPYKPSIIQEQQKNPPPSNPKRKRKDIFYFFTNTWSLFKDLLFRSFQRHPKKLHNSFVALQGLSKQKKHIGVYPQTWYKISRPLLRSQPPLKEPGGHNWRPSTLAHPPPHKGPPGVIRPRAAKQRGIRHKVTVLQSAKPLESPIRRSGVGEDAMDIYVREFA